MIQLDLDNEERSAFADMLESVLSDLRMEIADTDSQDFRQDLKRRKAVLVKVLAAFGRPAGD